MDTFRAQMPFTTLPNSIIRGGHGAYNLAILMVIMSHGDCFASQQTLAREVGCSVDTIQRAVKYWEEHGAECGILIQKECGKNGGKTNTITVCIEDRYYPHGTADSGRGYRSQLEGVPLTAVHKNNPIKNNPLSKGGVDKSTNDKPKRPYIEGDLAYKTEDGNWRVRTFDGRWLDYVGDVKANLVYK